MGINQIFRSKMTHTPSKEQHLRVGQIIQGRILKLFPNHKAQIQLGTTTMIAQLEAPLSIGEKYHFQVGSAGDVIHLKVIGDRINNHVQTNMAELLGALGMKASKENIHFAQYLNREKIPFDRSDLIQSFSLLSTVKNKMAAQEVLKEMIFHRLPINDAIFQALMATKTTRLSEQITTVLTYLKQLENPTELQQMLHHRLSHMTSPPSGSQSQMRVVSQIISEVNTNEQRIFNMLKISGLINQNIEFSKWQSQWRSFANQNGWQEIDPSNRLIYQGNMPFSIHTNEMVEILNKMVNDQSKLKEMSQKIMNRWTSLINGAVIKKTPLQDHVFMRFQDHVVQRFNSLLTDGQQEIVMERLQNNPIKLRQLLTTVQQFNDGQTYRTMEQLLMAIHEQNTKPLLAPKEGLLNQIRQMLLFSGITDENLLTQELMGDQQGQTIKSMLIQALQLGDGNERVQHLLHYINGLQLQSVQEVGSFVHAHLVVPGEKLLLNNDIYIEFESKKTEEGKINPDFCRILFYLDLSRLKETVIDMHIQKRLITITIFNDHQHLQQQTDPLLPLLKKGIESLNYQLTGVVIKSLQEKEKEKVKEDISEQSFQISYEGIEFRI